MLGAGTGTGFQAQGASIAQPTTADQATNAYGQSQNALSQQQALLAALQAQNGITNQSNVYNQLQGVANGTGPNPAQAMLANSTGANNAAQAALMAGQRGAGANVGLMARQAAQQGSANQQNAIGQGATLQANQSLNALNQLGGLATQQVGQQANATQSLNQAAQGEQQNVLGGIASQNNALVGMQSNMNNTNNASAIQNSKAQQGLFGGLLGGAGSFIAEGGMINEDGSVTNDTSTTNKPASRQGYADGGNVMQTPQITSMNSGPSSNAGRFLSGLGNGINQGMPFDGSPMAQDNSGGGSGGGGGALQAGMQKFTQGFGKSLGFKTPAERALMDQKATQLSQVGPQEPLAATDVGTADEIGEAGATDLGGAEGAAGAAEAGEGAEAAGGLGSAGSVADVLVAHGGKISKKNSVSKKEADDKNKGALYHLNPAALMALAKGGYVPAMVSPGERYLPPSEVEAVAKGKDPLKAGEKIPGKAKTKGDNYANDVVPKTLEAGGIVLPKSVMESKHPHWAAHKFVSAILAKQGLKKGMKR